MLEDHRDREHDCNLYRGTEATVTVGIPVFNGEKTIGQSIDSVLRQSHQDVCVWVSDNASTDGTREICLDRARLDPRVHYYRQEQNIGVFRNYDYVFRQCRTKYFKWQSSSDWCQPEFLEACVGVLESHAAVVLACPKVLLVGESGEAQAYADDFSLEADDPADRFRCLLDNIRLCNMFNGLLRTDALRRSVLNRPFLASDVVLLADLALRGKFVLLPQQLWFRRMTPETSSMMKSVEQQANFFSGLPVGYDSRVTWKIMVSLFEVVCRSRVKASARLRCLNYLLRKALWVRKDLWRELVHRG